MAGLSSLGQASGVTLFKSDGTFIAFNAELGTLDDLPSNGYKFDVMAPAGGAFGDYLSVESTSATVSFDVDFLDNEGYTVYVRNQELANDFQSIGLTLDGPTKVRPIFENLSTAFAWIHLSNSDFTPSGTTPSLPETVTLSAANGSNFNIDAVALVSTAALNRISGRFIVSDATIPEGALAVPEPSSALLFLIGQLLLFRRRR